MSYWIPNTDSSGNITSRPAAPSSALWSLLPVSFSASGTNIIVPAVAGQTVRVMRMFLVNCSTSTTTNITVKDTAGNAFTGSILLLNAGVFSGISSQGEPLWVSASGFGIEVVSTAAVQLSGTVWYTIS